ncbi:MAG: ferritin family protein [bacterium]|nr:ferritin family protein [bacterium]
MTNSKKNFITLSEVLDNAILSEANATEFYYKMQSIVTKNEVIGLLEILQKEEREHLKTLQEYKKKQVNENSYIQFTIGSFTFLPDYDQCRELTIKEMIEIAIEAEKKTAEYYRKLSGFLTGEGKKIFDGLAVFEETHTNKLKHLLLY